MGQLERKIFARSGSKRAYQIRCDPPFAGSPKTDREIERNAQ